ncbi:MAG TPA: S1 family peptidase [Pilimelia sp.]|nr:S1 family peptidase [Pilimelia sp.]
MDRRRLIASAVVITTVGAAAALTVPSFADTERKPAAPAATASESEIVAALRRDLSLTAEQAQTRLRMERWASATTERLRRDLGDGFAGAWLTAAADGLVVAVTDPAIADRVIAAGAQARIAAHSAGELDTVKRDLDRRAAGVADVVPGWYVDAATNSVVVLAESGSEARARRWVEAAGAPAGAVRVVTSNETPRTFADVRGGDPFFIDNRGRCSVGFSVRGGFVTAGHCGQVGSTTVGFDRTAQGVFQASSFPGDDFAFVAVNNNWTPSPVVNTSNSGELPVAGSQEAPVGASICRTGSTTGTRCGVIQAKNATVNYPEGTVPGLTRTDVCAEPGDSGGSWLSGDQAQGMTSGGTGDCRTGGITFFQPVNEVLQRLRLTLVTTGGDQNPPGQPSVPPGQQPTPVKCVERPGRTFRGSLSRTGARAIQPDGRFFRATAGQHRACLDGPDGADFDLVLQRWNGEAWRTVARATGSGPDEQIRFNGNTGFYRYRVESERGSGSYTLTF